MNLEYRTDSALYNPMTHAGSGDHNILVNFKGMPHPLDLLNSQDH
jgi:hypothetical protein